MTKKIRNLKQRDPHKIIGAAITIIGIAAVGTILLFHSHAANTVELGTYEGSGNISGVNSFAKETGNPETNFLAPGYSSDNPHGRVAYGP